MLRITKSRQNEDVHLVKLEGKLLEPWVEEVRGAFVGEPEAELPRLDLSGITFVDRPGTELLRQLLREGVRIESCPPFVAALLQWDAKSTR